MAPVKIPAMVFLPTILMVSLFGGMFVYAQNESNRITQPEQNTEDDELAQPETITTTEGTEEKIRCSNGALVDSGSECASTDECPSEPSENITIQCIQPPQQTSRNITNATNASSLVDTNVSNNNEG
jgi:hypothetical protein